MKAAVCYEFARVLDRKAASILQMALGRVGGILEAKEIARMAEAHYARFIIPPIRPGLGVELNEEVTARHPYTGQRLYLEVLDQPVS